MVLSMYCVAIAYTSAIISKYYIPRIGRSNCEKQSTYIRLAYTSLFRSRHISLYNDGQEMAKVTEMFIENNSILQTFVINTDTKSDPMACTPY